ncbi:MAG: DUF3347 domain-containing protein [Verrucomicrobiota bacterium]
MKFASLFAVVLALAVSPLSAADNAHSKTLQQYDAVRTALVADNLAAAKKAGTALAAAAKEESVSDIQDASQKLADSSSLKDARAAFLIISLVIEKMVKGQPGYFVVTCPMIKGSVWVQTTDKIGNPYAGREMPECGEIRK